MGLRPRARNVPRPGKNWGKKLLAAEIITIAVVAALLILAVLIYIGYSVLE